MIQIRHPGKTESGLGIGAEGIKERESGKTHEPPPFVCGEWRHSVGNRGMAMKKLKIIAVVSLLMAAVLFSGCDDPREYKGSHVDLNSVASNSIMGLILRDSCYIFVVDEDSYGRVMFIYRGDHIQRLSNYSKTKEHVCLVF